MEYDQLSPGTILAEKYRLESVLGVGGMGTVYRAEHLALRAPVALKVIDRKVEEGDVTLARFMREAQSAAALRSPHVVQILDYGMDHGRPFMVMELLEGEPLADRIRRIGRLAPEETYRVILHVAKAVSRAHEAEIVHRDLKPDNIFLVHNEGDELAKVLDFGVAKVETTALDGKGHTRTGSLLGTPYYMSPEQAQGNKDVDARSDLWALGVIAFECLTGVRPFQSEGLGDLVLQICIRDIPIPSQYGIVPDGFDAWFKKACEREPVDRFQTARELAEALRTALNFEPSSPESRWAPAVERVVHSKAPRPYRAENTGSDTTADQAGESELSSSTYNSSPISAPLPPVEAGGSMGFTSAIPRASEWQVVPHGTMDEPPPASRSVRYDADPLADTHESGGSSSLFVVALLAVLLGGGAVYAVSELGLWGVLTKATSSQSSDNGPTAKKAKPKRQAAETELGLPASPNLQNSGTHTSGKGTTSHATKAAEHAAETASTSDAERAGDTPRSPRTGNETPPTTIHSDAPAPNVSPSEGTSLEAIEKEAERLTADPNAPPASSAESQSPPQPKKEPNPKPVLPEELAPTPAPPPPATQPADP